MRAAKLILMACLVTFSQMTSAQNALDFDGVDDQVNTTYTGVAGTASRTMEAWINTSTTTASQHVIADYGYFGTSSADNGKRFTMNLNPSHQLRIEVRGWGLDATTALNDGNWHHVAVSYDGTTFRLIVDGVEEANGTSSVTVNTTLVTDLVIGNRIDGAKPFEGTIDEFRFWDIDRSVAEISAGMNDEMCSLSATNLTAYYPLNQGTAGGTNTTETTATEFTAAGNHGTLSGFALSGATSNWVTGKTLGVGFTVSQDTQSACGSYTWAANSQTYTTSGSYYAIATGSGGCDSIVTLDLTINMIPADQTTNVTECDSYLWSTTGVVYTSSTIKDTVLYSSAGCPYTSTLNLTINSSDSVTETMVSCGDYYWAADGQTYTTSGQYETVLMNATGCDSVITLDLTINTVTASAIDNGDGTLSATTTGTAYQWMDCNSQQPITGATSQTYTPSANGNYAVIVTENNCSDTSACLLVTNVGIQEINASDVIAYPVPSNGSVTLKSTDAMRYVEVYDMSGRSILREAANGTTHEIMVPEKGVYNVKIEVITNSIYHRRIVVE